MAPSHDRLASARTYIAIAESEDSKREAYTQAADEIIAWLAEDKTRSMAEVDSYLGKPRKTNYAGRLVRWRTSAAPAPHPFGGKDEQVRRDEQKARSVLRNAPIDQVVEIIANLPAERLHEISRKVAESASSEVAEALDDGVSEGSFPRRMAEHEAKRQEAIDRAHARGDTDIDRRLGDLEADHEAERLERAARYARAAEHALAGLVRTLKAGEHDEDAHGQIVRERVRRMRLLLDMTNALLETGEIDWDAAFEQVLVAAEDGES